MSTKSWVGVTASKSIWCNLN